MEKKFDAETKYWWHGNEDSLNLSDNLRVNWTTRWLGNHQYSHECNHEKKTWSLINVLSKSISVN